MEKEKIKMLGEMPVGRLIWKMSIPSMIGILTYNLYNIIDTIYISRGMGSYAAGGLAITFPLFILLSAVSSTMGAGAASVISRALGGNEPDKANRAAANTFGLFWIIAILITVFGLCFLDELLNVMGVTARLLPYAREYTRIILIGAVTSTGFSALIRAEGNSRYAMFQWIIPLLANMLLDPVFIFLLHKGTAGAAIATVISQCISAVMSLYYFFFSKKTQLNIKLCHFLPDVKLLGEIISTGFPSFIQLAGSSISIIIINNVLRDTGGDIMISTYGIVSKITVFLQIPLHGLLQGVQPVFGYNYGAGEEKRVREALKQSTILAAAYGILLPGIIYLLSGKLMYLFSSKTDIITIGSKIMNITCLGTVFSGINMIQTTFFQAIGQARLSFWLSLCNQILCFMPVLLVMSRLFGINGVWFSFPVSATIALGISSACILHWKGMIR